MARHVKKRDSLLPLYVYVIYTCLFVPLIDYQHSKKLRQEDYWEFVANPGYIMSSIHFKRLKRKKKLIYGKMSED